MTEQEHTEEADARKALAKWSRSVRLANRSALEHGPNRIVGLVDVLAKCLESGQLDPAMEARLRCVEDCMKAAGRKKRGSVKKPLARGARFLAAPKGKAGSGKGSAG